IVLQASLWRICIGEVTKGISVAGGEVYGTIPAQRSPQGIEGLDPKLKAACCVRFERHISRNRIRPGLRCSHIVEVNARAESMAGQGTTNNGDIIAVRWL